MLTDEQKAKLDALRKKKPEELTDDEKAKLATLTAQEGGEGDGDKTFSEAYVSELRKEAAKYRTAKKEADAKLAKYDGIDPEEYRKLKTAADAAEQEKLKAEGDWNKLRDKLIDSHKTEISKKDEEIAALKAEIGKLSKDIGSTILDNEIAVQCVPHEVINPKIVGMVVKQYAKVETAEDGTRTIKVYGDDGKERVNLIGPRTGKPMTVSDLMEELKRDPAFAHEFKGGKAGAGSHGGSGNSVTKNPWKVGQINLTEQGRIFKADPALAARLKAEAQGK